MEIKITYPPKKRTKKFWKAFCNIYNIAFIISLFVCPLVNICVGGKAWSIVTIYSIFAVWSTFIAPSLYDLNRTYQSIKAFLNVLILLILIEVFLSSGWAIKVIPIVSFAGIIVCSILFFSDFPRQKHFALPFILITLLSLGAGLFGVFSSLIVIKWMYIVLSSVSFTVFLISMIFLRKSFLIDFKKYFNTK